MSVRQALAQLSELAGGPGPLLVVLVGPNGAGKSTFYRRYLKTTDLPFINADLLAQTLIQHGAPTGEETERLAAGLADKQRQERSLNAKASSPRRCSPTRSERRCGRCGTRRRRVTPSS